MLGFSRGPRQALDDQVHSQACEKTSKSRDVFETNTSDTLPIFHEGRLISPSPFSDADDSSASRCSVCGPAGSVPSPDAVVARQFSTPCPPQGTRQSGMPVRRVAQYVAQTPEQHDGQQPVAQAAELAEIMCAVDSRLARRLSDADAASLVDSSSNGPQAASLDDLVLSLPAPITSAALLPVPALLTGEEIPAPPPAPQPDGVCTSIAGETQLEDWEFDASVVRARVAALQANSSNLYRCKRLLSLHDQTPRPRASTEADGPTRPISLLEPLAEEDDLLPRRRGFLESCVPRAPAQARRPLSFARRFASNYTTNTTVPTESECKSDSDDGCDSSSSEFEDVVSRGHSECYSALCNLETSDPPASSQTLVTFTNVLAGSPGIALLRQRRMRE